MLPADVIRVLLDVPQGFIIAFCANAVLFFVPTYLFHTLFYPFLQKRRIRYDKDPDHATVSFSNLWSMDPQLQREWYSAIQVTMGGLIFIEVFVQLLVAGKIVDPLPVSSPTDWWLIARQFSLYFVIFDAYYYFLHRFFFHSSWGWKMHKVHHDSFVVTPTTGFSFHWFEGELPLWCHHISLFFIVIISASFVICYVLCIVLAVPHSLLPYFFLLPHPRTPSPTQPHRHHYDDNLHLYT